MVAMRTSAVFVVALCLCSQLLFLVNAASVSQNTGDVKPCGRNPQGSSTPMPQVPASTPGSSTTPSSTSAAQPPAQSSTSASQTPAQSSTSASPQTTQSVN